MRRSVREALVGFSLLAALASGFGFWLWLKGVSLSRNTWTIRASFADAAGLAERSPVSYRGVLVGNVRRITVSDKAVEAELEIKDPRLRLSRPVAARVGASSLLGGDAMVSLLSAGQPLPSSLPGPRDKGCDDRRMVCQNGRVSGMASATIDSVTETVQSLLDRAEKEKLVDKLVAATVSFEQTSKETEKLTRDGQVFVAEAKLLVQKLNGSAGKIDPILSKADQAMVDVKAAASSAASATKRVDHLAASLDNPKTVADLQATLSNAKQLTDRWQAVGGDVRKLTDDPKFMDGIRSVSVGLGKFFQELYPAQTEAAKGRDERSSTQKREREQQQRRQEASRFAPRSNAPAMTFPEK